MDAALRTKRVRFEGKDVVKVSTAVVASVSSVSMLVPEDGSEECFECVHKAVSVVDMAADTEGLDVTEFVFDDDGEGIDSDDDEEL